MTAQVEPIVDPEFSALIPPLTAEEFKLLEEDIVKHGCLDPIVVWGQIVLDGHNRLAICKEKGLSYNTVQIELADREAAIIWIARNQLGRRNLSNWHKARLVLRLEPVFAAQAEKRMLAGVEADPGQDFDEGRTLDQLGKIAGLSRETLHKVRKLLEQEDPETTKKLDSGDLSIHAAFKDLEDKVAKTESPEAEPLKPDRDDDHKVEPPKAELLEAAKGDDHKVEPPKAPDTSIKATVGKILSGLKQITRLDVHLSLQQAVKAAAEIDTKDLTLMRKEIALAVSKLRDADKAFGVELAAREKAKEAKAVPELALAGS